MKILLTITLATMFFVSCSKIEKTTEVSTSKNELAKEVENVSKQLGIAIDPKRFRDIKKEKSDPITIAKALNYKKSQRASVTQIVSSGTGSQKTSSEMTVYDIANAVTYTFVLDDGQELISVVMPYGSNTNEFYNYIASGNQELGFDMTTQYNPQTNLLTIQPNGIFGGWWGCMKNFFGSDGGTVVNILGVAGGMGCVACGLVAGFITGVMAIACIHG